MAYVSTDLNRFYAALESSYGVAPAIGAGAAFRALRLNLELVQDYLERRDKTGSRTFAGVVAGGRRHARFEVDAYLIPSGTPGTAPNHGPFFQSACGGAPLVFGGGLVTAGSTASDLHFSAAHFLSVGQAVGFAGELRFVTSVPSALEAIVDPPFSSAPGAGAAITATVTYPLAASLPSLAIFDFWDPPSAQQRMLTGAAVDRLEVDVTGDFHQVKFAGQGQDVVDAPAEPGAQTLNGSPLAGHLGQIWLGTPASKFSTLAKANLRLDNSLDLRGNEFGSAVPLALSPGERKVTLDFDLFALDDAATQALYTAARARTSIVAHLQLGASPGSLFAAYLKGLVPQIPRYDMGEKQLRWSFTGSRAAGGKDDELWIAFG